MTIRDDTKYLARKVADSIDQYLAAKRNGYEIAVEWEAPTRANIARDDLESALTDFIGAVLRNGIR